MTYKLTNTSSILRIEDGAYIPADLDNVDYQDYLIWLNDGNTPIPFDTRTPAELLDAAKLQQIDLLSTACQTHIYSGFTSSALGAVYTYPAKDKDQSNLAGSVLNSLYPNLPTDWTTLFWCMDTTGVWGLRPHTALQIQQVGSDGKTAILAAIYKNANLASQVLAVDTTVADVQAIVW